MPPPPAPATTKVRPVSEISMLVMAHRYHAPVLVVVNGSVELARLLASEGFDVTTDFGPAIQAVVHVPDLGGATLGDLAGLDDATWDQRGEAILRDALHACQDEIGRASCGEEWRGRG